MDSLSRFLSAGEILDALRRLSGDINLVYDQIMTRIEEQDGPRRELARRVLCCVGYARRQLWVDELQHSMAVARGRSSIDDYIHPEYILTAVCAGLVVIDDQSRIVRFVRKS